MTRWTLTAALPLLLLVSACKREHTDDTEDTDTPDVFDAFVDADLTDPERVVDLANNASAPNMYTLAVLFGAALENEDGLCPTRSETDGVVTYTGGCTDADGDQWVGSATVQPTGLDSGIITYDGLGRTAEEACSGGGTVTSRQSFTGQVTIRSDATFSADMTGVGTDVDEEACTAEELSFAIEYEGQQVQQAEAITVWSGSGRYGDSRKGKVTASTADEILDDDGCDHEAESGTTTMAAGGKTAIITYDGATDCDPESTVTWTLDGVDQGELAGVRCGTGLAASGLAVGLAALLVVGRRRRER